MRAAAQIVRPDATTDILARVRPAWVVAGAALLAFLATAGSYGFHRDELYFIVAGRHPQLGYVDQPPLTPILSALAAWAFGVTPIAVRILPAIVIAVSILLTGDIARRLGGGRLAEGVASLTVASSGFVAAGHIGSTTTYDLFAWTVLAWLAVRLLDGGDRRLWPVLGLVMGLGLQNRWLVAFLGAGLAAGVLLARRWEIVRSPWAWASIAIALLVWAPNLAWQAANDWPQLEMGRIIGRRALLERDTFVLEVVLLSGSLMTIVSIVGLVWLLVASAGRRWRAIGWAAVVTVALVLYTHGKSYYVIGLLPPLAAAGAVALEAWLAQARWRIGVVGVAAAGSIALMAVITLPILPPTSLAGSAVLELYAESGEQVGWPELVAEVRAAADGLTPAERADAVIVTANYGEAAAIDLLGEDLPPVYSGHNGYWEWGPPPEGRSVVIVVPGNGWHPPFGACTMTGRVTNGAGVHNDEFGTPVLVCRGLPASWATNWPLFRHLD